MRVEIRDDVFAVASHLEILPIFHHAFDGRHRVIIADDPSPAYDAWVSMLDTVSKDLCRAAVSASVRLEASEPARHFIRVARIPVSQWGAVPPIVTLSEAVDFMQRPYRLLLEHSRADRAFLLAMTTEHERAFLEHRINKEWLEVENCGGIDGLAIRASTLSVQQRERLRCSAMFDSDAPRPGHPSAQAVAAAEACAMIHHRQLARRSIENYVPLSTLFRWGRRQRRNARKVRALGRMSHPQRWHYHMKQGLAANNNAASRAFFADLSPRDAGILNDGIGDRLSVLFASHVTEPELQRDGGWAEPSLPT